MAPGFDSNSTDQYDQSQVVLRGATDNTAIGNYEDRANVDLGGTRFPHDNKTDVSTTVSASGNTSAIMCHGCGCLSIDVNVTAISGTNPMIYFAVQISEDGTDWSTVFNTKRFSAIGGQRIPGIRLAGHIYRFAWTVTGTSPSITFNIDSTLKSYLPPRNSIIADYGGLNLASAGATSTTFTSANSANVSLVTRRAADGGNNGQFVVECSNDGDNWDTLTGNLTQGANTTIAQNLSTYGVFYYYRLRTTSATNAGTRVVDAIWSAQQ